MSEKSYLILMLDNSVSVLTLFNANVEYVKYRGLNFFEANVFWNDQLAFWAELKERESIEQTDNLNVAFVMDSGFSASKIEKLESMKQNWNVEDIERAVDYACEGNVLLHFPKGKNFEKVCLQKNDSEEQKLLYVLGYSAASLKAQRKQLQEGNVCVVQKDEPISSVQAGLGLDYFDSRMKEYENNRVQKNTPKGSCRVKIEKPTAPKGRRKKT